MLTGTFSYLGTGAFTNSSNSQARFDNANTMLQIDTDGDGTADMNIKLNGKSNTDIASGDFTWS